VRRAREAGRRSDLILLLEDSTAEGEPIPLEAEAPVWRVRTKIDLSGEDPTTGRRFRS
jgi:tRNA U34 5-carboxymethylaminomethyl modifying GTPase MnmE/TrmE